MIDDDLVAKLMPPEHVGPALFNSLVEPTSERVELSVVVPTRNEAGNIKPLLSRIEQATQGMRTEVIFVDDSNDDTPKMITQLQHQFSLQVALIARPVERRKNGLGGAVVEGLHIAHAPWVCVMDSDLQHPPELIPQLLKQAQTSNVDIVVGSRLASDSDASSLGFERNLISRVFALTTRMAFPMRLKDVTDPLSGFFMIRRSAINLDELRPDGFKILMEILVRYPELRVLEVPFQFGYRHTGDSKASIRETIRFLRLLLRLRLATDRRFMRFLVVGLSGLLVNNLALAAFTEFSGIHYLLSAVLATQVSTLWNFSFSESWVFGKRKSEHSFLRRFISFILLNNLMLLLRGPILSFMVEGLGVHYLLSNFISLFALTILRYTVADQWIWGKEVLPIQNKEAPNEVAQA